MKIGKLRITPPKFSLSPPPQRAVYTARCSNGDLVRVEVSGYSDPTIAIQAIQALAEDSALYEVELDPNQKA